MFLDTSLSMRDYFTEIAAKLTKIIAGIEYVHYEKERGLKDAMSAFNDADRQAQHDAQKYRLFTAYDAEGDHNQTYVSDHKCPRRRFQVLEASNLGTETY
jgi:hypothetical protein